jgi:hypothetical protein
MTLELNWAVATEGKAKATTVASKSARRNIASCFVTKQNGVPLKTIKSCF